MVLPYILQLGGLTFAIFADGYIRKERRVYLLTIVLLVTGLIVVDLYQAGEETTFFLRTLSSVYGYTSRPALLVLFIQIVSENKLNRLLWIIVACNALLYSTAFYTDLVFSNKTTFHRGPLGYTTFVLSGILLLYLMYVSLRQYRHIRKVEAMIPFLVCLLVVLATIADLYISGDYPISFLTCTVVSCCVFFYIWLHLQFVREHERALMAEQGLV